MYQRYLSVLPAVLALLAVASWGQAQMPSATPYEPEDVAVGPSQTPEPPIRAEALEPVMHATESNWADPTAESDPAMQTAAFEYATSAAAGDGKAPVQSLTPLTSPCGDITFKPGVRLQPRYLYDDALHNHDFFINRFRLKCSGDAYKIAKYATELKIDNTGRYGFGPGAEPKAIVENAWLDFKLREDLAYLRVGVYDLPFSRSALTSDSKLLFMDRSLVKDQMTSVGFADNTYGLMLHGRPYAGHLEYAVGLFDNLSFEKAGPLSTRQSDALMPAGRVVWHLLDPPTAADGYADYLESYIGEGRRLAVGAHTAYLPEATIDGANRFDLYGWGIDAFFNVGHFVFQTEYDWYRQDMSGATTNIEAGGWYVQGGYLTHLCDRLVEFAARYQEVDPNNTVFGDRLQWISLGTNLYIREHNLKIQSDYTFKVDEGTDFGNNVFQVQLQLEY